MGQQPALLVLICGRPGLTETTLASLLSSADVSGPDLVVPTEHRVLEHYTFKHPASSLSLIYLGLLAETMNDQHKEKLAG